MPIYKGNKKLGVIERDGQLIKAVYKGNDLVYLKKNPAISVYPTNFNDDSRGGTYVTTIKSALPITYEIVSDIVKPAVSIVDNNDGTHTATITLRQTFSQDINLNATIRFSNGYNSIDTIITIQQTPIKITPHLESYVGGVAGDTVILAITGYTGATTYEVAPGLTTDIVSIEISGTTLKATALTNNLGPGLRDTMYTVYDSLGYGANFIISQLVATSELSVKPTTSVIPGMGGSTTHTITIVGGTAAVQSAPDWVTPSIVNNILTITAVLNTDEDRNGVVVITNGLESTASVTVSQALINGDISILPKVIGLNYSKIIPVKAFDIESELPVTVMGNVNESLCGSADYRLGAVTDNMDGTHTVPISGGYPTNQRYGKGVITTSNGIKTDESRIYTKPSHLTSSLPAVVLGYASGQSTTVSVYGAIGTLSLSNTAELFPWLTATINTSTNVITIRTTQANRDGYERIGAVYVRDSGTGGTINLSIDVTQASQGIPSAERAPLIINIPALGGSREVFCMLNNGSSVINPMFTKEGDTSPTLSFNNTTRFGTISAPSNTTGKSLNTSFFIGTSNTTIVNMFQVYQEPIIESNIGSLSDEIIYSSMDSDVFLLTVLTEGSWLVKSDADWITCFEQGGNGTQELVFFTEDLTAKQKRTGTLTFTGTNWTATCNVIQGWELDPIELDTNQINIKALNPPDYIITCSPSDVEVVDIDYPDWITVTKLSNTAYRFSFDDTDITEERIGQVVFKIYNGNSATCEIIQEGLIGDKIFVTPSIIAISPTRSEPASEFTILSELAPVTSSRSMYTYNSAASIDKITNNGDGTHTATLKKTTPYGVITKDIYTFTNKAKSATAYVYGPKGSLTLSRRTLYFANSTGSTTITVSGQTGSISAVVGSGNESWLGTSVSGNTVTIKVNARNTGTSYRTGYIFVRNSQNVIEECVWVYQAGTEKEHIVVNPFTVDIPAMGGSAVVQLASNATITAEKLYNANVTIHTTSNTATITLPKAEGIYAGVGDYITFKNRNGGTTGVRVNQPAVIESNSGSLDKNSVNVDSGDFFMLSIDTEGSWLVSSSVAWCECFEQGGNGRHTLVFFTTPNTTGSSRNGNITFTGTNWNATCSVIQSGQ